MLLATNYHELILRPIHRFQQAFQRIEVARVGIHTVSFLLTGRKTFEAIEQRE